MERATLMFPGLSRLRIDREALRVIIGKRGFTVREVADGIGVTPKSIYRLLSGERIGTTYSTAAALADFLEIDVPLIVDHTEMRRSAMG